MNDVTRLVAAAAWGAMAAVCVAATGEGARQGCSESAELARISKRFDALEKSLAALQTQSAQSASDATLAHTATTRQLASLGSQLSEVNATVASLSDRVR
jgi:uncharacterized protein involved in exopolysaccharide biosynthesis